MHDKSSPTLFLLLSALPSAWCLACMLLILMMRPLDETFVYNVVVAER